jgi:hypothetical protein
MAGIVAITRLTAFQLLYGRWIGIGVMRARPLQLPMLQSP